VAGSLVLWIALREPGFCWLEAVAPRRTTSPCPKLYAVPGKYRSAAGVFEGTRAAFFMRRPGDRASAGAEARPFELYARSLGEEPSRDGGSMSTLGLERGRASGRRWAQDPRAADRRRLQARRPRTGHRETLDATRSRLARSDRAGSVEAQIGIEVQIGRESDQPDRFGRASRERRARPPAGQLAAAQAAPRARASSHTRLSTAAIDVPR